MKGKAEFDRGVESATADQLRRKFDGGRVSKGVERFFSLLLILAGVPCLVFTEHVYSALPYIVSCVLIVLGANDVIRGFRNKEYLAWETRQIANGIVNLLLGAVVLLNRADADNAIGSIWGFLGLVKGCGLLNIAIYHCARHERFLLKAVHAAVEVVLGILLLAYPYHAVRHHVFILGLELVLLGLQKLRESVNPTKKETDRAGETAMEETGLEAAE
ncbi:MAG: DUF308 domain-containing protein [Oscillospiraceae bacterium]